LLFILHDEHGGIHDHVAPPATVNPDGKESATPPFDFKRLGLRVPTLIVSPQVDRGTVDSTLYDHTSILATVRDLFNLPDSLTLRDKQANTVSHNLIQPPPRSDALLTLVRPIEPTADMFHADGKTASMTAAHITEDLAQGQASTAPLSEFQQSLVQAATALQARQPNRIGALAIARLVDNQHEGALHVRDVATRLLDKLK
jgi:arylsulfatase A-like enzyme